MRLLALLAWLARGTEVAVVIILYWIFHDDPARNAYVPKSQRSRFSKAAYEYTGILRSWIKCTAFKFEQAILPYLGKSVKRRHTRYIRTIARAPNINVARAMCVMAAVSMTAKTAQQLPPLCFDTDSFPIRVDNCATATISNRIEDFDGPLSKSNQKIKGIGGSIGNVQRGTIKWRIEDDNGKVHTLLLPNSYYVPNSPSRLLSPQHWAQQAKDQKPLPRGTWCATYSDAIVLQWQQRKFTKTIPLQQDGANVCMMYYAPGYSHFSAFCAECEADDEATDPICYDAAEVPTTKTPVSKVPATSRNQTPTKPKLLSYGVAPTLF